jgi:hypothetical protein
MPAVVLAEPDFDREVAPILAAHCLDCHCGAKPKGKLDLSRSDAALKGGVSGVALVPGQVEQSLLWQRIAADEMPPKKPLPAAEREVLRRWIANGARWGSDPIDPFRFTTKSRAGYDWWSLQPVQRPAVPDIQEGLANPIDRFVLARLRSARLEPAPRAERRTLIRRVYFDLLGLPPTPEEVREFVADPDPAAYARLVDRLLASPHYGERWARHWLDIVRFGESDGFERNTTRPNAWHYRDWLIRTLNSDMPYDHWCRLQLAGDVLEPAQADAIRATGFLVAGVHNTVLGNEQMRAIARQDELEDLAGVVGQTFLGLTINCARCHEHKFDPVSQRDYYRLVACLSGVQHGERDLPNPAVRSEHERLVRAAADARQTLHDLEAPARQAIVSERRGNLAVLPPTPLAAWDFRNGLQDQLGTLHLQAQGEVKMTGEGAVLAGKGFLRSAPLNLDLREKTLEAWVRLDNLTQRGGGVMSVQTPDGAVFDAVVFGEREPARWMAGSEFFKRTRPFGGAEERVERNEVVHLAITYASDGQVTAYRNGQPYGKPYRAEGPTTFQGGKANVVFGCRHEPSGGNKMLSGTLVQARLHGRALGAAEVAASAELDGLVITEADVIGRLSPEDRKRRQALQDELKALAEQIRRLEGRLVTKVYAALVQQPAPTRVLNRGQVTEPLEVVPPGGIPSLQGLAADFGLPPDAPESERRRRLAEWITSRDNPLFARVMVNRLWQHHFGVGLVETSSDFGFNGGRPSHPELLDWLAAEFRDQGFRLKAMHRLILLSDAYQRSSKPRAEALKLDADSRLLWRRKPLRHDAETLRDAMLSAAGLLNRTLGGKGFSDYRETFLNGTTYFEPFDPVGPEYQRRSVYRFTPRGANQGLLDAFDCPDPAASAPRRAQTTTPTQALALWNNAFSLRMAEALAARLEREADSADARIARAWQIVYQREPRPEEMEVARGLVREHGLPALGRVLFNSNEFLTIE